MTERDKEIVEPHILAMAEAGFTVDQIAVLVNMVTCVAAVHAKGALDALADAAREEKEDEVETCKEG